MTIDFPALDGETSAEQLLAACVAGEWADRGDVESCRLVEVEWPDRLPGPAFPALPGVSVGAIVKPALGLAPAEAATVAAELATGGAVLVKDDELQLSSPERVRAVNAALPERVLYAANVTGVDADAIVEAGARALMINAFLAGLGSIAQLREYGLPIFVHRVGSAFLRRGGPVSVSARVLAELTRLLGADYVQVGSFSPRMFDTDDEVREQILACHHDLNGVKRATASCSCSAPPRTRTRAARERASQPQSTRSARRRRASGRARARRARRQDRPRRSECRGTPRVRPLAASAVGPRGSRGSRPSRDRGG